MDTHRVPYIYILRCGDGSYYTGSTWHIEQRVEQHALGKGSTYTSARLPVELVFEQWVERVDEAYALERRIHGWSRAKKEALIRGDWHTISRLAKGQRTEGDLPSTDSP